MSEFDTTATGYLQGEVESLKMSNERLIAELGRIAAALGVDNSMAKVLAKIKELKEKPWVEAADRIRDLEAGLREACDIADNYNVRGHNDYDEADKHRIAALRALAVR